MHGVCDGEDSSVQWCEEVLIWQHLREIMSQLLGVQHVDPFAVENPSSLSDWMVPVSFMKSRHFSNADSKDNKANHESWRVKDRVQTLN